MYRALESFSGLISAKKNEIIEVSNNELANDLLKNNLIEKVSDMEQNNIDLEKEIKSLNKSLEDANATVAELTEQIEALSTNEISNEINDIDTSNEINDVDTSNEVDDVDTLNEVNDVDTSNDSDHKSTKNVKKPTTKVKNK